jgi:hypothetical protein
MQITAPRIYATHSWEEILWLLYNRIPIDSTQRVTDRCVRFSFRSEKCQQLIDELYTSESPAVRVHRQTLEAVRRGRSAIRNTPMT